MIDLSEIHERNIYYGDMKAANLLIYRNQEVKIGDMGICTKMNKNASYDDEIYEVKGLTEGFANEETVNACQNNIDMCRNSLVENDKYALVETFKRATLRVSSLVK